MKNTDDTNQTSNLNPKQAAGATGKGKLKVAIDTHADFDVWMAQYDGTVPKPPQKLSRPQLIDWLGKRKAEGWDVVSCYEAGPFGYQLHRALTAIGVRNYVIRPRNWDDEKRRVRTDRTDTRSMLVALDRYEAGQVDAFTVIRVPTETEEQRRIPGRIGQRLKQTIRTLAQSARGHALLFGVRLKGAWYSPRRWPEVMKQLPASLRDALGRMRTVILCAAAEWQGLRALILQGRLAGEQLPVGVGRETAEGMEAEVCDWNRFANRGAVGNFSGLTPGEASSGPQRVQGSITKCGNGRLRWLAVQTAWRLVRFQPDYRGVQRFKKRALEGTRSRRRVRQWIVALAREFLIDWWRVRTGRTTTEKLGLRLTQA